jgi:hypothetical protein
MNFISFFRTTSIALTLPLILVGCGDDHDNDHSEEVPPLEDACEHMEDGPFEPTTAVADGSVDGAMLTTHTRWNIDLIAVDGGNGGSVSFAPAEAGEFLFALASDVPMMVFDATGAEVVLETPPADAGECSLATTVHAVDTAVGTYTVSFGPTDAAAVSVVVVPSEHDEHE